ncbi:nucleosome assembly protein 1-like 1 [Angomonas deanei]|uniref:Nucleosome assembly protein (NAP), putative n=1 Tax=Angomonas deanei TaxID=59799 RepID=S9VLK3_9TRYP|nr:nucleosome assembly protein 1-like 1 [Angomonas deanei]EPY28071.1 nucleosome assembly protein 1-like 1 [Angomonas deanei]CAD2213765.1 Nucleosome assembly protein (NAP), putative [Angomonas deanei]|eukprot:EPY24551.1 nucleosome assembly protein 1-like 1 [Angomonas deanei]
MPAKAHYVDPHARAPPTDSESEDEEDLVDLLELMKDLTVDERRQIYALKGLLNDFREVRKQFLKESHALEEAQRTSTNPLLERRRQIVNGESDITEEELTRAKAMLAKSGDDDKPETEEKEKKKGVQIKDPALEKNEAALLKAAEDPNGGIPGFWLGALMNSNEVGGIITERDVDALKHLTNIEMRNLDGEPGSFALVFTFSKNEYFTNETLTKTYLMEFDEYDDDYQVADVKGDIINWTSPKQNLTVITKQKKQRSKKTKEIRVVEKQEKCDSFFNFFKKPKLLAMDQEGDDYQPEDGDDSEDDDMFLQQEMDMDVEVAQVLSEQIIPQAATYYSGKNIDQVARAIMKQFGAFGQEDEDEEEEDEEEDDAAPGQFAGMATRGRGRGAAGRGRGGDQQQDCKQQ